MSIPSQENQTETQAASTTSQPATDSAKATVYSAAEMIKAAKSVSLISNQQRAAAILGNIMKSIADEAQKGKYKLSVTFTDVSEDLVNTLAVILRELGYKVSGQEAGFVIQWDKE